MPLQIPNGYVMATQEFILSGRANPYTVVTGHENAAASIDYDLMAGAIRSGWELNLALPAQMRVGYSLGPCTVLVRDGAGVLHVGENSSVTAGTASVGNAPPPNCSLIITKRTGLAGPKYRGRMYLPPFRLNEGDIDQAGNFSTGTLPTVAADQMADWAPDLPLVLLHTGAEPPTPVTSLQVQGRLATQRRRMR